MSSRFEPDVTIDLHGRTPDAAMALVEQAVNSGRYVGKSVEIVHGYGRGVLRERVRKWGANSSRVKRVLNGEDVFLPGGGATLFFL